MTIRVGIVGLGGIGALYDLKSNNLISHLKTVINDKRFTLKFGYDVDKNICGIVKRKYKLNNIFDNVLDIKKNNADIDLLVIASPTSLHLQSLELFLEFTNPSLILCEKPLANSYHEAKKIESICNKRNVPIVTNFMRRSLPAFIDLKKVINKNINQNHDVIIKYSGCFKNNGSHFVDLMNFIFGNPKKIIQKSSNKTKNNDFKVNATVKYLNAICSYIPLYSEDVSDHEIQIMNSNQKVLITRAGRCMEIFSTIPDIDFKESNEYSISKNIETDYLKFQSYVYNDLYKLITSDLEFRYMCGIKDAVTNIKFLEKLINE